ncbi:MAG: electron transporter, partial [Desulfofustis sp.]|nr:electron transporter [Desulfofustis sp.]
MEFTREIYWNVGHGPLTLVPMYLLALGAMIFVARSFYIRSKVYRLGKELNRFDNPGARVGSMINDVLFQNKVRRGAVAGLLHSIFFWGFFILVIGTTLVFLQADFTDPLFGFVFLKGNFYKFFSLALDLAGLAALIMLAGLFIRRYILKPEGLETKRDDALMHGLLFVIIITGFIIEGARMAVTEAGSPLALWSPVGLILAKG